MRQHGHIGRGGSYPAQGGRPQGGGESGGRQREMGKSAGCGRGIPERSGDETCFEGTRSNISRASRKSRKLLSSLVPPATYQPSHEQERAPLFLPWRWRCWPPGAVRITPPLDRPARAQHLPRKRRRQAQRRHPRRRPLRTRPRRPPARARPQRRTPDPPTPATATSTANAC